MLIAGSTQSRQRQAGAAIVEGVYEAFEDHLSAPRGQNRLTDSPLAGTAGGAPCGDLIRIAVLIDGDTITDAGFTASGCGAASAAASATVELITNTKLLDAARLTAQDISNELGGLSPGKIHAATLAADAMHTALGKAAQHEHPRDRAEPHARRDERRRRLRRRGAARAGARRRGRRRHPRAVVRPAGRRRALLLLARRPSPPPASSPTRSASRTSR